MQKITLQAAQQHTYAELRMSAMVSIQAMMLQLGAAFEEARLADPALEGLAKAPWVVPQHTLFDALKLVASAAPLVDVSVTAEQLEAFHALAMRATDPEISQLNRLFDQS